MFNNIFHFQVLINSIGFLKSKKGIASDDVPINEWKIYRDVIGESRFDCVIGINMCEV